MFGMTCLDRSFYNRPTDLVAMELLGNKLVRIISNAGEKPKRLSGIIVETEAYGFKEDAAGHAFRGQTPRNALIFVWTRCGKFRKEQGISGDSR